MTAYGLEFVRLTGRDSTPKVSRIPADSTPAEEITAFMFVMKRINARVKEITAGIEWVIDLSDLKQVYKVKLIQMDDLDTQVDLPAVVVYGADGKVAS